MSTARTLPARQFLTLDTLVSRATAAPSTRVATKSAPRQGASAAFDSRPTVGSHTRKATALETLAGDSTSSHVVRPPTPPSALALWVTVATCACGRVHRLPPTTVLIKYAENEHSFHYARDDAALAALPPDLPREVREKSIVIPYCEGCFTP